MLTELPLYRLYHAQHYIIAGWMKLMTWPSAYYVVRLEYVEGFNFCSNICPIVKGPIDLSLHTVDPKEGSMAVMSTSVLTMSHLHC